MSMRASRHKIRVNSASSQHTAFSSHPSSLSWCIELREKEREIDTLWRFKNHPASFLLWRLFDSSSFLLGLNSINRQPWLSYRFKQHNTTWHNTTQQSKTNNKNNKTKASKVERREEKRRERERECACMCVKALHHPFGALYSTEPWGTFTLE